MAVRRQLQQIFQDPRVVGTIVVEQASASAAPAAPAWKSPTPPSPPPPSPLPPPSPPPPSSSFPPAAVPASPPRQQGPLPEECAVFHCRSCWTVLGDSLQLCAQEPPGLSVVICFKVTSDVTWEDSLLVGLEGALLECSLAYLRGLFCFFKDSIICYLLQNQMIIEASKVKFPAVTLKEHMHKVKEKLVDFNCRIELVIRKLEKL
ncbi:PREDICTED: protein Mis18-beta isoform X2 [Pseudopodoces humilis]|uniref:protein Mis18-beta isoform X2 n=1 Tax=Pseudopodoces humilis TaxID=181119 RepID=UPI0006B6BA8C|nr:PREDICTED: protein Mis18-beta isoform X2 [Pseudopodoces humilis]